MTEETKKIKYPIEFFFNKDGTYDGMAFETDDITDIEADLIEELLDRLANVQTHRKLIGSKTFKEFDVNGLYIGDK